MLCLLLLMKLALSSAVNLWSSRKSVSGTNATPISWLSKTKDSTSSNPPSSNVRKNLKRNTLSVLKRSVSKRQRIRNALSQRSNATVSKSCVRCTKRVKTWTSKARNATSYLNTLLTAPLCMRQSLVTVYHLIKKPISMKCSRKRSPHTLACKNSTTFYKRISLECLSRKSM